MSLCALRLADRDAAARAALYRTRVLVNRTPHFTTRDAREANRGLDLLDAQLGRNQVNLPEAVRGVELLNRAPPSLAFGLLRDAASWSASAPRCGSWGCAAIEQRLDEVPQLDHGRADPGADRRTHATATTCRPTAASMPRDGRSRRRPGMY